MNDSQLATLWNEVKKPAYAAYITVGKYQDVADALNARASVANPTPRPTRPKLIAWDTFMGLLAAADVLKMFTYGVLPDHLKQALAENNRPVTLAIWRGLKTALTAPSITAVETEAAKTEPDPTWPATILAPSIAMNLGLPSVRADDVKAAVRRYV